MSKRTTIILGVLAAVGAIVVTVVLTLALSGDSTSTTSTGEAKTPATAYRSGYEFMQDDMIEYRNRYDYAEQLDISTSTCIQMGYRLNATGEYGRGGGTELMRGCNDALAAG